MRWAPMTKPSTRTGAASVVAGRPVRALKAPVDTTKPVTRLPLPFPPTDTDLADRLAGLQAAAERFLAEFLGPNQTGPPAAAASSARRVGSSSRHNDNVAAARHRLSR